MGEGFFFLLATAVLRPAVCTSVGIPENICSHWSSENNSYNANDIRIS